jgi:hypothetical protein
MVLIPISSPPFMGEKTAWCHNVVKASRNQGRIGSIKNGSQLVKKQSAIEKRSDFN